MSIIHADLQDAFAQLGQKNSEVNMPQKNIKKTDGESVVWPENIRILLVDDNDINREVALGMLLALGLSADEAVDGKQALIKIEAASHSQPYHLIFMDCQMPVMDGFTATTSIREGLAGDKNTKVTIIAMTANAMAGDKQRCLDVGMDDYLSKPVDVELLLHMLKRYLLSDEGVSKNEKQSQDVTNPLLVWDKKLALKYMNGNDSRLQRILVLFLNQSRDDMDLLRAAIGLNDWPEIHSFSHKIKGVAGHVGATKLSHSCKALELLAKKACDADAAKITFAEVDMQFQNFCDEIQAYLNSVEPRDAKAPPQHEVSNNELYELLSQLQQQLECGDYIDAERIQVFTCLVLIPRHKKNLDEVLAAIEVYNFDQALLLLLSLIKDLKPLEGI